MFYTRETIRGIRILPLTEVPPLFMTFTVLHKMFIYCNISLVIIILKFFLNRLIFLFLGKIVMVNIVDRIYDNIFPQIHKQQLIHRKEKAEAYTLYSIKA